MPKNPRSRNWNHVWRRAIRNLEQRMEDMETEHQMACGELGLSSDVETVAPCADPQYPDPRLAEIPVLRERCAVLENELATAKKRIATGGCESADTWQKRCLSLSDTLTNANGRIEELKKELANAKKAAGDGWSFALVSRDEYKSSAEGFKAERDAANTEADILRQRCRDNAKSCERYIRERDEANIRCSELHRQKDAAIGALAGAKVDIDALIQELTGSRAARDAGHSDVLRLVKERDAAIHERNESRNASDALRAELAITKSSLDIVTRSVAQHRKDYHCISIAD